MVVVWVTSVFFALLIAGLPIAFCMGLSGVFYFIVSGQAEFLSMIPHKLFTGLDSFVLLAVPFFMLAGEIMDKSHITDRLIRFSNLVVGRLEGGLAHVNVVSSMLFAGITGTAVGDVAALGTIFIPGMKKEGYDLPFSAAITASSSLVGPIIPPSVIIIIYCAVTGISVGGMFAAAIVPGLMIGVSDMVIVHVLSKRRGYPKREFKVSMKEYATGFKDASLALIMPLIILGGILLGVFTPTEAAATAVGYACVVSFLVYRSLKVRALPEILYKAAFSSCKLLIILGCVGIMSWVFGIENVPDMLKDLVGRYLGNKYVVLCILNIFLMVVGMWMTTGAAIMLFAPILEPLALSLGIHPFTWGTIMLLNLVIGLCTPPVGVVLFAVADVAEIPIEQIFKAILPMLIMDLFVLVLVNVLPGLTLFIPRLFGFVN